MTKREEKCVSEKERESLRKIKRDNHHKRDKGRKRRGEGRK